jgi:hypothetical protein
MQSNESLYPVYSQYRNKKDNNDTVEEYYWTWFQIEDNNKFSSFYQTLMLKLKQQIKDQKRER